MPSSAAAIGIVLIALGAVVVVLLAGGPDRWAAAAGLLVGVPVLVAMGGAVDEARRTRPRMSQPASATPSEDGRPPRNALVRTSFALAAVLQLIPLVVAVLMVGLAVRAWLDGDVVAGCLLVVFALIGVWRGWQTLRHLIGRD
jgi:cation transporter-like permease